MPARTRHVWVAQEGVQVPPLQGLVLDWRRHSYRWWALVIVVQQAQGSGPVTTTQWLPSERLTPVKSNPNGGSARFLGWA